MDHERRRHDDDVLEEVLLTLRQVGHEALADELAEHFREQLERPRWLLAMLKAVLHYGLLTGASVAVAAGFIHQVLRREYVGALLTLLLGCLVFGLVTLFWSIGEALEGWLQEEGLGTQEDYTRGGR